MQWRRHPLACAQVKPAPTTRPLSASQRTRPLARCNTQLWRGAHSQLTAGALAQVPLSLLRRKYRHQPQQGEALARQPRVPLLGRFVALTRAGQDCSFAARYKADNLFCSQP